MNLRRPLAAVLAAAGMLALPATAAAEPARTVTLNAATTQATWEDGPRDAITGTEAGQLAEACSETYPCDDTLVKLEVGGTVEIKLDGAGLVRPDMDLYLFFSDETGTPSDSAGSSATPAEDETLTVDLEPGFYLLRAEYFSGLDMTYKGSITLTPKPAAPAPAPAPVPAASGPPATPKVRAAGARGITGTASAPAGVAKVEVAVLRRSGRRCQALQANGRFRTAKRCAPKYLAAEGTERWSFKPRRPLARGRYTYVVRVTDRAGATKVTRKTIRIR